MSDIAIRVENLGKQYPCDRPFDRLRAGSFDRLTAGCIGAKQERYRTLRDTLADTLSAPFRRLASIVRGQSSAATNETIRALKDVSFEVKRGEAGSLLACPEPAEGRSPASTPN